MIAGSCLESMLGVAQLFVQFVLFSFIFVLYMIYFSGKKISPFALMLHLRLGLFCIPTRSFPWTISLLFAKIILGNFVVTTMITIVSLAFVNDTGDRHSAWTLTWAGFLGVTSVFLAMIQYIPQIIETFLQKSVGALSIPMMLIQTPGAIIMTVSLALSPGANWSTWLPYAFTVMLQTILLGFCIFYYIKAKRRGLSSFHVMGTPNIADGTARGVAPETRPLLATATGTMPQVVVVEETAVIA
ncbi:hypothetical protein BGZ98_008868 [Dissophora globulifera]|nr:hypothetical protein BGZ98_008868 [Dissophora globulifera]